MVLDASSGSGGYGSKLFHNGPSTRLGGRLTPELKPILKSVPSAPALTHPARTGALSARGLPDLVAVAPASVVVAKPVPIVPSSASTPALLANDADGEPTRAATASRPARASHESDSFGVAEGLQSSSVYGSRAKSGGRSQAWRTFEPATGLPYIEEQRRLLKRNKALELALKRVSSELASEREEAVARLSEWEATAATMRAELTQELGTLRTEYASRLQGKVQAALDQQLIELTGSVEEQRTLRAKQERDQRVEILYRQARIHRTLLLNRIPVLLRPVSAALSPLNPSRVRLSRPSRPVPSHGSHA